MATPHVSGLVAYFIGKNGNLKPADMAENIKSLSLKDILTNIRESDIQFQLLKLSHTMQNQRPILQIC